MGNLTVKESGEMVNIISPNVSNITSFKVHFSPRQEGSGDPSPDNVREITGWNGVEGYISNVAQSYSSTSNTLTTSIDWTEDVGTVYGGYVDLISGELVAEYEYMTDTWGNWGTLSDCGDGTELRYKRFTNTIVGNTAGQGVSYCNVAKYSFNNANGEIHFYNVASSNNCRIYLPSGTDESLQIQVVGKLAEPIRYQLTPQQLTALRGANNIYSNANGQTEIKYWKH